MTSPATPPARSSFVRSPEFRLVLIAGLLALAVAVAVGMMVGASGRSDAAASARPTPAAPSRVTPVVPAAQPASPATSVIELPTDCAQAYTRDWTPDFSPLVLNPAWTKDPASGVRLGSRDDVAVALLDVEAELTCSWGHPAGGSDRGLTTNLATLTAEESDGIVEHFGANGYECFEELGGTRCIVQSAPSADGESGESHFVREGVWVATRWVNIGPDGYTHDIITAIFG